MASGAAVLAIAGVVAGGYWTWFTHRRQPPPVEIDWFRGVTYRRDVRRHPRPLVVHTVRVDLQTPGVGFVFTPADAPGERPLRARTVSTFAREQGTQVAVNANFFYPFWAGNPLNYYPHEGDPVQVVGTAGANGAVYHEPADDFVALYFPREGPPDVTRPDGPLLGVIAGNWHLVRNGQSVRRPDAEVYPRTAIGLDRGRRTLLLMVVDGKQPGYSEGVTADELADLLANAGAWTAINLDGGGSSALVREADPGRWELVSSPSNFRMPWWERPVANHLGIRAERAR
jgi:hypothetical protein